MPIPIRERGYPHPELLAETDWLAGRLSDPTVRVVDARFDEDHASGHIPGAVHINGFSLGGIRPGPEMPAPEAFAHLVGALGIDERTPAAPPRSTWPTHHQGNGCSSTAAFACSKGQ